jgi:hypothetical protein
MVRSLDIRESESGIPKYSPDSEYRLVAHKELYIYSMWGPRSKKARAGNEGEKYKNEEEVDETQGPLAWWAANHHRYPKLARAARDYFGARSTSADSERVFSGGRQMISEFRHSLSSDTIRTTMLLQSWMKALDPNPREEAPLGFEAYLESTDDDVNGGVGGDGEEEKVEEVMENEAA